MFSVLTFFLIYFFFSSRRRHTRSKRDWSSDVCSSDLLPIGDEAHGRVVRQSGPVVGPDTRIDTSQPAGLRSGQRDSEEAAPYTAPADVGVDVRADDAPPFRHVVRVAWPGTSERLKAEDQALSIGNGARDRIRHIEVPLAHQCVVDRAVPKACAVDRVLYLGHGLGVRPAGTSELDHAAIFSQG